MKITKLKNLILSGFCFAIILYSFSVYSADETLTLTSHYPAPFGDYESVKVNSIEINNKISNLDSSAVFIDFNNYKYININKGVQFFGDIVGSYSNTKSVDANVLVPDVSYIKADAASQNIVLKGSGDRSVTITLDQDDTASKGFHRTGIVLKRDNVEKKFIGLAGEDSNKLVFKRSGTITEMIVDQNGNLGVGTDSPFANLHAQGEINPKITITNPGGNNSEISLVSNNLNIVSDTSGSVFKAGVSGTEVFTVLNNGKAGLGISNPTGFFHMVNNDPDIVINDKGIASSSVLFFQQAGDYKWAIGKNSANDFFIGRKYGGTWNYDVFTIDYETGNVGVGCSSSVPFKVNGGLKARVYGESDGSYIAVSSVGDDPALIFNRSIQRRGGSSIQRWDLSINSNNDLVLADYTDGNSPALCMKKGTGQVGIGTSAPSSLSFFGDNMLDVSNGKIVQRGSRGVIEIDAGNSNGPTISFGTPSNPDKYMTITTQTNAPYYNVIDTQGRTLVIDTPNLETEKLNLYGRESYDCVRLDPITSFRTNNPYPSTWFDPSAARVSKKYKAAVLIYHYGYDKIKLRENFREVFFQAHPKRATLKSNGKWFDPSYYSHKAIALGIPDNLVEVSSDYPLTTFDY